MVHSKVQIIKISQIKLRVVARTFTGEEPGAGLVDIISSASKVK